MATESTPDIGQSSRGVFEALPRGLEHGLNMAPECKHYLGDSSRWDDEALTCLSSPPPPIPPLSSPSWGTTASPALRFSVCIPTSLITSTRLGVVSGWAGGDTRSVKNWAWKFKAGIGKRLASRFPIQL